MYRLPIYFLIYLLPNFVLLIYPENNVIACGALKTVDESTAELARHICKISKMKNIYFQLLNLVTQF